MTNISGSVLRAVADWYDTQHGTDVLVSRLRDDAEKVDVEVEQVDRLAKVYADAFAEPSNEATWDQAPDYWKDAHRAGMRAVLDKLAEDRDTTLINNPHVQLDPRVWMESWNIPGGVVVTDRHGEFWERDGDGWLHSDGGNTLWGENEICDEFAPFTEVVDGAQ